MPLEIARYDPSRTYRGQPNFDCGHQVINGFVVKGLRQQVQRDLSVAYVLTDEAGTFIGFLTLMMASIGRADLAAVNPGSLPFAVPVTKLAMLGVSVQHQDKGYGRQLLRCAIRIVLQTAESIGTYGLYLDADDNAYDFYARHGFVPLKQRNRPLPTPMILSIKTARLALPGA